MPSIFFKYARCAELGRTDCVSVSWESVERAVTDNRKKIRKKKEQADKTKEKKIELERRLRIIKDRRIASRRKVRRFR